MPWLSRRSRPATRAGHRRHSSIVEGPNKGKEHEEVAQEQFGPPERLSLRLSGPDGEPFSVLTDEPEEIAQAEPEWAEGPVSKEPSPNSSKPDNLNAIPVTADQEIQPEQERASTNPLRPQRFSLLKFRHASDPQLSTSYKQVDTPAGPNLPPPAIITTSPTANMQEEQVRKGIRSSILNLDKRLRRKSRSRERLNKLIDPGPGSTQSLNAANVNASRREESEASGDLQTSANASSLPGSVPPPPYGDESSSALALPITRLSDSSQSEGSSDDGVFAQTTTTHLISTTTTFFRLPRRKKDKGPLFPLPPKVTPTDSKPSSLSQTPQPSIHGKGSNSPDRKGRAVAADRMAFEYSNNASPFSSPSHSTFALTNAPSGAATSTIFRKESMISGRSGTSTPTQSLAPPRLSMRGRSSTVGSLSKSVDTANDPSPVTPSGRTSTSTAGRKSFGDIFSLSHRFRYNSEPQARNSSGASPGTPGSKSNSMQIPRETEPELVYPERDASDTPASYIEKLEAAIPRGAMASVLCKSSDDFSKTCLRKYMRGFSYFGDAIDMSIRKMLMEVILPKETQQIDRLLAGFADRYHECNPGVFLSADEAAIVAFSILLLHSDTHNKNNKRKMQKQDYVKNTQGPVQLSADILECFYDNVCYTPFIHFEDDVAIHSHRLSAPKAKKSLIRSKSSENLRGPIDPYTLILDNKLNVLRPSLKEVMDTEDNYKYTGTLVSFDVKELHTAFVRSGVLQIVSARSRPDAFSNQATISNPAEAQAGLVSIKVAKVGLLWRKDPKKKKAKRPWQEWGAILTDSKLYFFRDVGWIKKLMAQYDAVQKQSKQKSPLVYHPPLSSFEPDALMSMDDAVALTDSSYKRHKNAFVFIKHGGFEEIFLANSEADMNDWLGKLNYAAAFRTAGVRMRGLVGTPYEIDRQHMTRKGSQLSTLSHEAPAQDSMPSGHDINPQMAWEIMFYRRQIINERISDYDEKLAIAQKELDHLLRNARHLQILLPIQAKTREAIVLAAGRMSAKLKWTRIEVWRTKCHRDLLKVDIEQEKLSDFPAPQSVNSSKTVTPQKNASVNVPVEHPSEVSISAANAMEPQTTTSSNQAVRPPLQTIIDYVKVPENSQEVLPEQQPINKRRSMITVDGPASGSSEGAVVDQVTATRATDIEASSLQQLPSLTSSSHSKFDGQHQTKPGEDYEDQGPQEVAGSDADGTTMHHKRPPTSGSDMDRVGDISPEITSRERGSSVRRSLQRTLRDSHHGQHAPVHHRSKKGRESGSSFVTGEDGMKLSATESEELKRSTGSFLVHGKKASVVTFGSEWQAISNEERMKRRKSNQEEIFRSQETGGDTMTRKASLLSTDGPGSNLENDDRPVSQDGPEQKFAGDVPKETTSTDALGDGEATDD